MIFVCQLDNWIGNISKVLVESTVITESKKTFVLFIKSSDVGKLEWVPACKAAVPRLE